MFQYWEYYCWMLPSITGSPSLNSVCSVPPDQLPAVSGFGPHKAPDFIERFGCWGLFLYLWLTDRNDGPQSELIISHTEQLSIGKSALTIIYNISILYQSSVDIRCFIHSNFLSFFIFFFLVFSTNKNDYTSLYMRRCSDLYEVILIPGLSLVSSPCLWLRGIHTHSLPCEPSHKIIDK